MDLKEILNLKELWLFWISVILIVISVFIYKLSGFQYKGLIVLGSLLFFAIISIFKFMK